MTEWTISRCCTPSRFLGHYNAEEIGLYRLTYRPDEVVRVLRYKDGHKVAIRARTGAGYAVRGKLLAGPGIEFLDGRSHQYNHRKAIRITQREIDWQVANNNWMEIVTR